MNMSGLLRISDRCIVLGRWRNCSDNHLQQPCLEEVQSEYAAAEIPRFRFMTGLKAVIDAAQVRPICVSLHLLTFVKSQMKLIRDLEHSSLQRPIS